jgi:RHS repeat-associated protein
VRSFSVCRRLLLLCLLSISIVVDAQPLPEHAYPPLFGRRVVQNVDVGTRALVLSEVDLALSTHGAAWGIARHYDSSVLDPGGPFGRNWDSPLFARVRALPNGDAELHDGTHRVDRFRWNGSSYVPPIGLFVDLRRSADGWVVHYPDDSRLIFDQFGRLSKIADRNATKADASDGNWLFFVYDSKGRLVSVVDEARRSTRLHYYETSGGGGFPGQVSDIVDFTGRKVIYRYDAKGRLKEVEGPDPNSLLAETPKITYQWEDAPSGDMKEQLLRESRLVGRTDGGGNQTFQATYETGLTYWWAVSTITAADGDWIIGASGKQRLVTNSAGETTTWQVDDRARVVSHADAEGNTTTWNYDDLGRQTSEVRPLGDSTIWTYPEKAANQRDLVRVTGVTETPTPGSVQAVAGITRESSITYGTPDGQMILTREDGSVVTIDLDERRNPKGLKIDGQEVQTTSFDQYGRLVETKTTGGAHMKLTWAGSIPAAGAQAQNLFLSKIETGEQALNVSTDRRGNVIAVSGSSGVIVTAKVNDLDLVERIKRGSDITVQRWDAAENLVTIDRMDSSGPEGVVLESSSMSHDAAGRLESMTRNGLVTTWSYDAAGRLQTVDYPGDSHLTYAYDAAGRLIAIDDSGAVTSYVLDGNGRIVATTGPDGVTLSQVFDGFGRAVGENLPTGLQAIRVIDALGRLIDAKELISQGEGMPWLVYRWTRWEYDDLDRMTAEERMLFAAPLEWPEDATEPAGTATPIRTEWIWNDPEQTLTEVDPRGGRTVSQFGDEGHVGRIVDAAGNSIEYEYDEMGRVSKEIWTDVSLSGATESGEIRSLYDRQGRLIHVYEGSAHRDFTYDQLGRVALERNLDGAATRYEYDDRGMLLREIDAEGRAIIYGWNDAGRLISLKDPNENETTFGYDTRGNRTRETRADGSTWTWTWTPGDELATQTDPNGTVTTWTRNSLGDVTGIEIAKGAGIGGPSKIGYVLDPIGRVVEESTNEGVVLRYAWDSLDRLVRVESLLPGEESRAVEVSYDANGNPDVLSYPSGFSLDLDWTPANRLASAAASGADIVKYEEIGSRVLTRELANGIMEERSYVPELRHLQSFSQRGTAGLVEQRIYDRTPLGLKRKVMLPLDGLVRDYGLDRTGWIELETETNAEGQQELIALYDLDPAFNYERIERIVQSPTERSEDIRLFNVDNRNRYTTVHDDAPNWDANGNLVSWRGATLRYDAWNRLVGATLPDGRQLGFIRDGSGNVVRRSVSGPGGVSTIDRVVWENDVLEEWAEGGLVGRYVYGREIDEIIRAEVGGGLTMILYPLQDELQNVLALTGESGAVLERYRYDGYGHLRAFDAEGEALGAPSHPWSRFFQGREALPGLEAYDFRNRVLWPELGRFGQEDPLGFSDSPNLYQAMLGHWSSNHDPLGLAVESDGPPPYGLRTGQQAHTFWTLWVIQNRPHVMGRFGIEAYYNATISRIVNEVRGAYSVSKLKPDAVSFLRGSVAEIWELKPVSYESKRLSAARQQMRLYKKGLAPATEGASARLNSPIGDRVGIAVYDDRPYFVDAYSRAGASFDGLIFYVLTPMKKGLRERVADFAEAASRSLCVAGHALVGTAVGTVVGAATGGLAGGAVAGGGGLLIGGPAVGIVAAVGGAVEGSVIGGAVGGVTGTLVGGFIALEECR